MKKSLLLSSAQSAPCQSLRAFLGALTDEDAAEIRMEPGEYRIFTEDCERRFVSSAASPNGEKDVAFSIRGKRSITLDGGGAELVFCDRLSPFVIEDCESVTLKNFSMDYAFLRYAFAKVLDTREDGLLLSMDPAIDHFVKDGHLYFRCGSQTLSTRERKISMKRITESATETYFMYADGCEAVRHAAASHINARIQSTEDGILLAYSEGSVRPDFSVGDTVCLAYDNDRENPAFLFKNCKNLRLENISIYRNGGMGIVADTCDGVTVEGLSLAIKAGREEFYSSTADGLFFTNCTGECIIRGCEIRDTYDDAMNIHGYYTVVRECLSDTRARLGFFRPSHSGLNPYRVGDRLTASDPESGNEVGDFRVTSVSVSEDLSTIEIETDGTLVLTEGMQIENKMRMPRLLLEGCTIVGCPHVRLSAPYITVRDNDLDLKHASILIHDLFTFWGECGAVTHAEITGNRFGKRGIHSIVAATCRPQGTRHIHERIEIRENEFAMDEAQALNIESVSALTLENNRFGVSFCK